MNNLESEEDEEGNHQTEETHSLGEGKAENGVREELLLEARVTGVADDERTEHSSDTGSGSGDADGGGTSTNELGGGVDVTSDWRGGDVARKAHAESWRSDELTGSHFIVFPKWFLKLLCKFDLRL